MSSRLRTTCVVVLAVASMVVHARPQQPRVAPGPVARGTAAVAGVVLSGDQHAPVRQARVTLSSTDGSGSWTTMTDDEGGFVVANLPAGRFSIEAAKPAWITGHYGARRPGRPGTSLVVADGARVAGLEIRMSRGAVITGMVLDRHGRPVPGVVVTAMQFVWNQPMGERVLNVAAGFPESVTDDQGVYRSFGLQPGDYVVAATLRSGPAAALIDLERTTEDDVQRALSGRVPAAGGRDAPGSAPLVSFAPLFYPGTPDVSRADRIRLSAGEERTGVNIVLEPVASVQVEAIPVMPADGDRASLQVALSRAGETPIRLAPQRGRPTPDGHVVFNGVTPGAYVLTGRAAAAGATPSPGGARGRGPSAPFTLFGSADVVVDGRDLAVTLEIQPGVTVSGRLRFPDDPARVPAGSISLALLPRSRLLSGAHTKVDSSGRFRFAGVPPGQYRLLITSGAQEPWVLRSAMSGGSEVLDAGLDVRPGEDVTDLVVSVSEQLSELAGRLETAAGAAAPDYFIIVFAADRSYWTAHSRRVRGARPDSDGRFSVRGLPAGEYFIAALSDVEPGEWSDPAFLDALAPAAVRVAVREGERTTRDLRIK